MKAYAASVKWMPYPNSHMLKDHHMQALDPGFPHMAERLRLYASPPPQQANSTWSFINPANKYMLHNVIYRS